MNEITRKILNNIQVSENHITSMYTVTPESFNKFLEPKEKDRFEGIVESTLNSQLIKHIKAPVEKVTKTNRGDIIFRKEIISFSLDQFKEFLIKIEEEYENK